MKLFLYGRAQCHLCDRLEGMIRPHVEALGATIEKRDIDTNPQWRELYRVRIPVLTTEAKMEKVLLEGRPEQAEVERVLASLSAWRESRKRSAL